MKKAKNIDQLIEEATVDCYDEYEQKMGFASVLEDKLKFPFPAKVVGEEVTVTGLNQQSNDIEVICQRNNKSYRINILSLEYDPKKVRGGQWIEAYRKWS